MTLKIENQPPNIKRLLKRLSKRLKKLSDQKLFNAHKQATNNFIKGDNTSLYIMQIIENELKERGVLNLPKELKWEMK